MLEPNFELDAFAVKDEIAWWKRLIIGLLGGISFVLALIVLGALLVIHNVKAAPTQAELVSAVIQDSAVGGGMVIVRLSTACEHESVTKHVAAMVREEYRARFKAGVGLYKGVPYRFCWIASEGTVLVLWEDGGVTQVLERLFVTPELQNGTRT